MIITSSQPDHVSNINGLSKRPLPNRLDRMVDQVVLSYLADDNDVIPSRSRGKLLWLISTFAWPNTTELDRGVFNLLKRLKAVNYFYESLHIMCLKSPPWNHVKRRDLQMFLTTCVLKNFALFTGKHLCCSLSSCEYCKIFENSFFTEQLWWLLLDLLIDFIIMKHFLKIILFSNLGATDMKTWGILVTIFQMETCTTWKQNCVSLTSQLKLKKFVRHGHRHWLRQRRLNFVVKRHITVGIFQLIKFELTDNWKIIW